MVEASTCKSLPDARRIIFTFPPMRFAAPAKVNRFTELSSKTA